MHQIVFLLDLICLSCQNAFSQAWCLIAIAFTHAMCSIGTGWLLLSGKFWQFVPSDNWNLVTKQWMFHQSIANLPFYLSWESFSCERPKSLFESPIIIKDASICNQIGQRHFITSIDSVVDQLYFHSSATWHQLSFDPIRHQRQGKKHHFHVHVPRTSIYRISWNAVAIVTIRQSLMGRWYHCSSTKCKFFCSIHLSHMVSIKSRSRQSFQNSCCSFETTIAINVGDISLIVAFLAMVAYRCRDLR